jgi:hypothetical protein
MKIKNMLICVLFNISVDFLLHVSTYNLGHHQALSVICKPILVLVVPILGHYRSRSKKIQLHSDNTVVLGLIRVEFFIVLNFCLNSRRWFVFCLALYTLPFVDAGLNLAVVKLTTVHVTKLLLYHKTCKICMIWSAKPVLTEDLCIVQKQEFSMRDTLDERRSIFIRDESIFSSERMLHTDYYRKGSVEKKNLTRRCPEIGISSIDWSQLSRFYLRTETESNLRNVVLNENRTAF